MSYKPTTYGNIFGDRKPPKIGEVRMTGWPNFWAAIEKVVAETEHFHTCRDCGGDVRCLGEGDGCFDGYFDGYCDSCGSR